MIPHNTWDVRLRSGNPKRGNENGRCDAFHSNAPLDHIDHDRGERERSRSVRERQKEKKKKKFGEQLKEKIEKEKKRVEEERKTRGGKKEKSLTKLEKGKIWKRI